MRPASSMAALSFGSVRVSSAVRRIVACVCAATLIALGGCASLRSIETQVQGEVERIFAVIRENGATATHGAVRFDLWSRTLHIDGIALEGEPGTALKLEVGSLRAATLAARGNTVVAGSVEMTGVRLERGASGTSERRIVARIPELRVSELVLPQKPAGGPILGDAAAVAAILQAVRVGSISARTIELEITTPSPVMAVGWSGFFGTATARRSDPHTNRYTYTAVRIDRIAEGRIGTVRGERIDIEGEQVTGIVGGFTLGDLDITPLLAEGARPRRNREGASGRIVGRIALGATSLATAEASLSLAGASAEGLRIDTDRLSPLRLLELTTLLDAGGQISASRIAAVAAPLAELYEGIELARLEVQDVRLASASVHSAGNAGFLTVNAEGLERGRLRRLRVQDLAVSPPGLPSDNPTRIGAISIEGFQLARLMRLMPAVDPATRQRPPEAQQLLTLLEGIEVSGLVVPDPVAGRPLRLERARIGWAKLVNGLPSELRVSIKGEWPLGPGAVALLPLRRMGFPAIAIDADLTARYDPERGKLTLAPIRINVEKVGVLDLRFSLSGLSQATFTIEGGRLGKALPDLTVERAELRLTDGGVLDLLDRQPVPGQGTGTARAELLASFRRDLDAERPAGGYRALLDALERFLARPRQTLEVVVTPRVRTSVDELSALSILAGRGVLQGQLERFDVTATATAGR